MTGSTRIEIPASRYLEILATRFDISEVPQDLIKRYGFPNGQEKITLNQANGILDQRQPIEYKYSPFFRELKGYTEMVHAKRLAFDIAHLLEISGDKLPYFFCLCGFLKRDPKIQKQMRAVRKKIGIPEGGIKNPICFGSLEHDEAQRELAIEHFFDPLIKTGIRSFLRNINRIEITTDFFEKVTRVASKLNPLQPIYDLAKKLCLQLELSNEWEPLITRYIICNKGDHSLMPQRAKDYTPLKKRFNPSLFLAEATKILRRRGNTFEEISSLLGGDHKVNTLIKGMKRNSRIDIFSS